MGSDEDLMVRVQAGDTQALSMLIDRWRDPLHAFLWRRVGESADDLFQETWIRIARARDRFDHTRRFSTWMFQIANNLCRDRWRRLDARRRAFDALRDEKLATEEPATLAEPRDDQRIQRSLAELPERLREILVLRYYQDLGEAEIAEVLGIPRGTVKSRLHTAVRAVRTLLGDDPDA